MGTPNFARPNNASKYYVVLTGYEVNYKQCPDCNLKYYEYEGDYEELKSPCCNEHWGISDEKEYKQPEHWECDDLMRILRWEIENVGGEKDDNCLGDRSYPISSLGIFRESKWYGDIEVTIKVTAIIQSAYYEGATLDWLVEIETDNETFKYSTGSHYDEKLEDIMEMVFDYNYSDMNAGLCKLMQPLAVNWVEQTLPKIESKLEEIYEQYSEHKLYCKGVFSNGEAIYQEVS